MKNKKIILFMTLIFGLSSVMQLTGCAGGMKNKFSTVQEELCNADDDDDYYGYSGSSTNSVAPSYDGYVTERESESEIDIYMPDFNTEEYNTIKENSFEMVSINPLSTFAIDVDTGSYSNLRRMINQNGYTLSNIPSGSIRTEELLNYFDYTIEPKNISDGRFSVQYETGVCPWNTDNGLLLMTIQANEVDIQNAGNNFVFLIDTSGSMSGSPIETAINSYKMLVEELDENDRVSIVTYAGNADTILEGCKGSDKNTINKALDSIAAGGGTNGSGGIIAAYDCALKNYITGGNNRVILASDGDMNLGITSQSELVDLIKEKKESGVFLTTLGYGYGNYSDANMEQIADAGNGNYFYIDSEQEAHRVLVEKMMQTTITVAKDVKLQAEFNPSQVYEYRLIGYENRKMSATDFENDKKDGGEVGAGQQVTVLYEIVYANEDLEQKELKYQTSSITNDSEDLLTLAIRYKEPDGDKSILEEYPVTKTTQSYNSKDWMLAAGCAEFSMIVRNSDYIGTANLDETYALINQSNDGDMYRKEFAEILIKLGADRDSEYTPKEQTISTQEQIIPEIKDDKKEKETEDNECDENMVCEIYELNLGTPEQSSFESGTLLMAKYQKVLTALNKSELFTENNYVAKNISIDEIDGEYIAKIDLEYAIDDKYAKDDIIAELTIILIENGFSL